MSFFKRLFSRKKKEEPKPPVKKKKPPQKPLVPDKDGFLNREAVILKFSAPEKIKEGEVLKVVVAGNFSNAGWKIKEAYAEVDNDTITLTVMGYLKAGMMYAQVIKKYETVIEITGLKKGTYKIQAVKGTDETAKVLVD